MADWLDYTLSDFLLFGPAAYWGLFSQQNAALGGWIGLPIALAVAAFGFLLGTNANRVRLVLAGVAVAWAGSAQFLFAYYATINWAVAPLGWVFLGQAVLLAAASIFAPAALELRTGRLRAVPGLLLFALGGILYPLVGPAFGRPLSQAEILGLSPDATALATLGLLAMSGASRVSVGLSVVPILWCSVSAATLFTLGSTQGWLLIAGVLLWAGAIWARRASAAGSQH